MTAEPLSLTTPPASVQAEEALLGSFLINPDLLKTITVSPKDFYIVRNRWIAEALLETAQSGNQVDYMTVTETLQRQGKLQEAGGAAYLTGLVTNTPTSLHAETYAEIVLNRAQRRRMLEIASSLAKSAYDLNADVDIAVSQSASDLANSARPKGGAQHVSYYSSRHYDRIYELSTGKRNIQRIPTGFIDFDKCLGGGLRIPEMLMLLGKPGLGKTKFILQLAFQMGQQEPGAVYEMETDEDQIMDREVSRRTEIPDGNLEIGQLSDDEWTIYTHAIEELANPEKTKVYMDFGSRWTTNTLRADLARLKAEYGITWYMVDYAKFLLDAPGLEELDRVSIICGRLKQINRELNLASVVIHSMTKEGQKNQVPDLTNMTGNSSVGFDTDKALFMTPYICKDGEAPKPNYRTFVFGKSRSRIYGPMFHLQAVNEFPAFLNVATDDQVQQEQQQFKSKPKPRTQKQKPPEPDYSEFDLDRIGDLSL
jgi:replicative DNA helicase